MFGCLLEMQCDVSTYNFHSDVFQQRVVKTGYQTLHGLGVFAVTAAPLFNSWQNILSHSSSQFLFGIVHLKCPDFPPVIYLFSVRIFVHGDSVKEEREEFF